MAIRRIFTSILRQVMRVQRNERLETRREVASDSVLLVRLFMVGFVGAVVFGLFAVPLRAQGPGRVGVTERHVLVISVDGLGASLHDEALAKARIPHLRQLREERSFAEVVQGVYPSLTHTAHTTIVTGRRPAGHGIYTNHAWREAGRDPGDWFWYS